MPAYLRCPPPDAQRTVVEHYWMVDGDATEDQILVPNGRPALAVALGTPGHRHDPITGTSWLNAGSLFGVMTRPHVLTQSGPSSYIGVELKPWGIAALDIHDRLVDQVRPIDSWLRPGTTEQLARTLSRHEFGPARAAAFADWLDPYLRPIDVTAVLPAVELIERARGTVAIARVARELGVPYSTLHRRFRALVGVSPKQFAEIVRFFHFVGGLLDGPAGAVATLAALHGYYDQSHAARDFKRYTGVSASSFRAVSHGIAALMHERSVQDGPRADQPR